MNVAIHESWKNYLQTEFDKPYFKDLTQYVDNQYKTETCFPPEDLIFNAFNTCTLEALKVVIIGQDPYHNYNQANGLSFSVNVGVKHPPSLVNIFKEIETDLNTPYPSSGNLEHWAKQGVFLLNATLTVRAHEAGSHQNKGWETFTDAVIKTISNQKENVVFLLWGGFAKKKAKLIDGTKHHILTSGHPSPLSANRGYWFGNKHFSQTNSLLISDGLDLINW
ncbi:uracil-DNA glycosylase [Olleya marilimosa]|uniref:Uracil-DNA glycosylase n=1 Tax=Olleya marilimosa TaxID=272164 RepID=A0ABR8LQG0_9FLAO|nr:uracil-DNA glycosylase [Olleya marilimosa]MBD3861911.1 uracil-DNA glycosylase [Olleya marilimosa]MBD3889411.1 uracil-DNA glycosylase [Olleya marilimosa]